MKSFPPEIQALAEKLFSSILVIIFGSIIKTIIRLSIKIFSNLKGISDSFSPQAPASSIIIIEQMKLETINNIANTKSTSQKYMMYTLHIYECDIKLISSITWRQ